MGWLHRMVDKADCCSLRNYFTQILEVKMKKLVPLARLRIKEFTLNVWQMMP